MKQTTHTTLTLKDKKNKGFSLIELLVAISIFLVLSTTLLFNYNGMNLRLTLDMLAHQTAQWVRETQVSAMSVRHTIDVTKFPGYGLHFDRANPSQFVFFADFDGDKRYTNIPSGMNCKDTGVECQQVIKFQKGNLIASLCSDVGTAGISDCGVYLSAKNIDIVFTRPDPDAVITVVDDTNAVLNASRARITLQSFSGYQRTIEVWTTGQISVQ